VDIHIQHISGSKAGLEQTFSAAGPIRLGREQSNDVVFDPHRDILVSGRHAEITFDGRQWVLRDLGSSNGTYVGAERITVRPLASGETIQFGRGGPQLRLRFQSDIPTRTSAAVDNPGTRVMSIDDLVAGNHTSGGNSVRPQVAPVADGTMMMSRNDVRPARAQAGPAVSAPRASSPLRIVLLVAALAFFVGIMGLLLLKPDTKPAAVAPAASTAEIEKLKQDLAAREAQLAELQRLRSQSTDTGGVVTQDLERQYVSAQSTIDALRQELERKNDEVVAAANKPPQVLVKYLPAPQPRQQQPVQAQMIPPVPSQPQTQVPAQAQTYEPQREPQPVPAAPTYVAPSTPERAVAGETGVRPAPARVVAEPPQIAAQSIQRHASQPAAAITRTAPPVPEAAPLRLANLKRLKRRVVVTGVNSDIPFPDAPRNLPTELAKSIGVALASSSEYYVDRANGPTVRITPTLYRSVARKSDSGNVVNKVKGIGSILGGSVGNVKVPVRAQSVAYDAALAAQVTVESASGRVLTRSTPSSSVVDRRSSVAIVPAKTAFGDLLNTDTPQSDVIRNVVGLAVDDIMRALATADAEISVKSVRGAVVTLDAGRNANVAPDDVFDITEGNQAIARVRVESVQDGTAIARVISGEGAAAGKSARYAGTDITNGGSAIAQLNARSATVRAQTEAREAPGASFKTVAVLRPGVRATYLYSVGSWSKVTNGDSSMWVPTNTIEVN